MRADDLRTVLLVKAVEESDSAGVLLPKAECTTAARAARREHADSAAMDTLLAARARKILTRLLEHHPVVGSVLAVTREPRWLAVVLIAASLAGGFGLSALDGTRNINILGFPLLGLVVWNLAVYALLVLRSSSSGAWITAALQRLTPRRTRQPMLRNALVRFAEEWYRAAGALYRLRTARMLHLAALALALGLIGGLYLRGLVLEYRATWASTFLDGSQVRAVLAAVYGPASLLTGVPLPGMAEVQRIRTDGESAARWIHLMAATVALFVVIPRGLLAAATSVAIARRSRELAPPAGLRSYFRNVFAASQAGGRVKVSILPYAYEPAPPAAQRLRERLPEVIGGELAVETEASTPYGEEDALLANIEVAGAVDVLVLLFSLAATPEDENHGALISGARDVLARRSPAPELVVLVDEAPYAARLGGGRLAERRALWEAFVQARGVEPRFIDSRAGDRR